MVLNMEFKGLLVMALFLLPLILSLKVIYSPRMAGKGLNMSVYVVFVSLFVWGWILGPVGFFLGVPLTLIIIRYLENFDETRWLSKTHDQW